VKKKDEIIPTLCSSSDEEDYLTDSEVYLSGTKNNERIKPLIEIDLI
jgi:hypothetical protein